MLLNTADCSHRVSSLQSTPSVTCPPVNSPVTTPALDDIPDFCPAFYHVVEFSKFVVAQAQYLFNVRVQTFPPHIKPRIPRSFSYNEVVDATFIVEIAVEALCNQGEFYVNRGFNNLIPPVAIPWDSAQYISEIGLQNTGKNTRLERDLLRRFPVGPAFFTPAGNVKTFVTPLTIADQGGRIMFWYLPDIITRGAQVGLT
jgi:hypothetical protein